MCYHRNVLHVSLQEFIMSYYVTTGIYYMLTQEFITCHHRNLLWYHRNLLHVITGIYYMPSQEFTRYHQWNLLHAIAGIYYISSQEFITCHHRNLLHVSFQEHPKRGLLLWVHTVQYNTKFMYIVRNTNSLTLAMFTSTLTLVNIVQQMT